MIKRKAIRNYRRHEPLLKKLSKQSSFTLKEANKIGVSHPVLLRLVREQKVTRLQRGIYSVTGSELPGNEGDFSRAHKKFDGKGVIGGLTALSHYHLVDEISTKIWILVPPTVRTVDKKYRLLRTTKDLNVGVRNFKNYQIVSIERALVDGLIYSSKIGERIVITAILRAIKTKKTTAQKLFEIAKKLDAMPILNKHWQLVLAGLTY